MRDPIFRYMVRLLRRPGEAEELTQEVFLRLYDVLRAGERVDDVRAWSYRVAHNLAMNLQKREATFSQLGAEEWDELMERLAADAVNAEQELLAAERVRRMDAARRRLSPQERQCLDLRLEGLRYREIARVLDVSLSTVVTVVGRAVTKIAKETA